MIDDANRDYDGFDNLFGGMDGGRLPNLIDRSQCAEADNCIFRGGPPFQRPSFLGMELTFDNPNLAYDANGLKTTDVIVQSIHNFQTGLFQGALYYAPAPGKEYIMVTIGGRLYRITPSSIQTARVFEVGLDWRNRSTIPINYMLQAGAYHITQDGEAAPIIYDGTMARRAALDEIFTGKMMGQGMGRIVLVANNGDIYFGDIFDGMGNGDADMLKFTETLFLNGGFPSRLPAFLGSPRAIQFVPQQDTATGVGECLVFGERGVESFFLSIPRSSWQDSAFQVTALLGIGCTGHRATAILNADIWFRAPDGWRSYRQAVAQIDQWAQIPMSTEVSKWADADTASLLNYCSAISFDKRLIGTCTPYPNTSTPYPNKSLYHNGMLSLDFDILSSFGTGTGPAWDGHWSDHAGDPMIGAQVMQLVEGTFNGEKRAFAFVLNANGLNGINGMVEIQRVPSGTDTAGPITTTLTGRSSDFGSPYNLKSLYSADAWVDRASVPTLFVFSMRADQYPVFQPFDFLQVNPIPGVMEFGGAPITIDGYVARQALTKPSEDVDIMNPAQDGFLRNGYEFQPQIQWTGRAALRKFRMHAQRLVEASGPNE